MPSRPHNNYKETLMKTGEYFLHRVLGDIFGGGALLYLIFSMLWGRI